MNTLDTSRQCLALLDLTNLQEDCTPEDISTLCEQAQTPYGDVAAICIWPRFVTQARTVLGAGNNIRIATVVNFPHGTDNRQYICEETIAAIDAGADEIDMVIPWHSLIAGDNARVSEQIAAVREVVPQGYLLKTILETGELKSEAMVREASRIAINAGADFIKTSTGKVAVSATPQVATWMLEEIAHSGKSTGFKPAGGLRTVFDAKNYLDLAKQHLGAERISPATLRFGASGLRQDLLDRLDGKIKDQTGDTTLSSY